jgi:hypothetical protein
LEEKGGPMAPPHPRDGRFMGVDNSPTMVPSSHFVFQGQEVTSSLAGLSPCLISWHLWLTSCPLAHSLPRVSLYSLVERLLAPLPWVNTCPLVLWFCWRKKHKR